MSNQLPKGIFIKHEKSWYIFSRENKKISREKMIKSIHRSAWKHLTLIYGLCLKFSFHSTQLQAMFFKKYCSYMHPEMVNVLMKIPATFWSSWELLRVIIWFDHDRSSVRKYWSDNWPWFSCRIVVFNAPDIAARKRTMQLLFILQLGTHKIRS